MLIDYRAQRTAEFAVSLVRCRALQDNDNVLDRLRLWICSGETLPVALADQFFATFGDHGKTLANFYGSTEVMGDVTYHLLSQRAQLQGMEKVPIGKDHFFFSIAT